MSGSLRVLVVIELGTNWGHLLRMLPIVRELRARGHRPLLTVPDVAAARKVVMDSEVEIVRTPGALVNVVLATGGSIESYAQILDRCVFGDDATLEESLRQWRALLAQCRPDVVIADFAPGALFVAHLLRLPLVRVNAGWEVPSFDGTLPIVRPWLRVDMNKVRQLEAGIVARLNRWCDEFGVRPYESLKDLYDTGVQLMSTFAETDHFGPRPMNYIGTLFTSDRGPAVQWRTVTPSAARKRVFVYLARDPRNGMILEGLKRVNADVVAVLPGIRKEAIGRFAGTNIRIWDGPVQTGGLLPEADLVIHNGGNGLLTSSLLAGVPLLIQPIMVEQALITRALQKSGMAQRFAEGIALRRCAEQIAAALGNEAMRSSARAFAAKYAAHSQARTLQTIVETAEAQAEQSVDQI